MSDPTPIPKLNERQLHLMHMIAIHGLIARIPPHTGDKMFEKLTSDWEYIGQLEEWELIEDVSEDAVVHKALVGMEKQFGRNGIRCYGFTQFGEMMFGMPAVERLSEYLN
jgi:hypothetical protein